MNVKWPNNIYYKSCLSVYFLVEPSVGLPIGFIMYIQLFIIEMYPDWVLVCLISERALNLFMREISSSAIYIFRRRTPLYNPLCQSGQMVAWLARWFVTFSFLAFQTGFCLTASGSGSAQMLGLTFFITAPDHPQHG